jgi:catechol 2,3-dioxygenase-like lactoylglutathione lyase family enzyme
MILYRHLIRFVLLVVPFSLIAQNQKAELPAMSFEHVRINVADKEKTAKWYVDNVGLEIMDSSNTEMIYVTDKDHNFMIELSSIPGIRNTYSDVAVDTLHLAFEGHKTIEAVAAKMLAAGGTQDGELYRNKIGDYVINVRDPNGFNTQLLHRVKPFFKEPVNSTIRFEHLAFNTVDQKISALWYAEFMNLTIPWSKDIELENHNYRNYRVPYVGDQAGCMSFELFGKEGVPLTFAKMKHQEFHVAFTTDFPEMVAKQMMYGGAKMIGTPQAEPSGDVIVDMVDPIGFPLRLIKRKTPILVR